MMTHPERRAPLAEIEEKSWHLWAMGLIITGSLCLGIVLSFYPALHNDVEIFARRYTLLPQLVLGLLTLVLLSGVYIVAKERELNEMRRFIVTTCAEAALLRDSGPQDPLTGVLARSALPEVLAQQCAQAERLRHPLCLVLFDIQEFSRINEREGNLAGDLVLKELARVLRTTVRLSDTVLRYGADQFLCFLAGTECNGAAAFVSRVHKACERVSRLRNLRLNVGISVYQAGADPEAIATDVERDLAAKRPSITLVPMLSVLPGQGT